MSETNETHAERVVEASHNRGEFVVDVDGFTYFWPDGHTQGYYAAYHLRWLADELDLRNEKMQAEHDRFFEEQAAQRMTDDGARSDYDRRFSEATEADIHNDEMGEL